MVYVIRGSEDGVYKVSGSYRKAYESCVTYVYGTPESDKCMVFEEFKASLKQFGSATIEDSRVSCEALRMEIE